jgi:ubiquinone/menaquinone biosynthesis C-methylase UbiE
MTETVIDMSRIRTILSLGAGRYGCPHGGLFAALDKVPNKVATDLNEEHLETWVNSGWIPIKSDIRNLSMFVDKSFDMVVATDIIEHVEKEEALDVLKEIDRIARKISIIFTPRGFFDTPRLQPEAVHSDLDVHKSGWQPEEFEALGYKVNLLPDFHVYGDEKFDVITGVKYYGN